MKQLHDAANAHVALVSEEDIQGCRDSILWSLRAVGTAVGLLGIEDEEFQQWVVEDKDYESPRVSRRPFGFSQAMTA